MAGAPLVASATWLARWIAAARGAVDDRVRAEGDRTDGDQGHAADDDPLPDVGCGRGRGPGSGDGARSGGSGLGPLRVGLHVVVRAGGDHRVEGREVLRAGLALDLDLVGQGIDGGGRLEVGARRAGGVAGPPGTTAGGLAGLLRAEPSSPTGSVKVMYAASSAATWARAQPRISGGAAGEIVADGLVELVNVLGGRARAAGPAGPAPPSQRPPAPWAGASGRSFEPSPGTRATSAARRGANHVGSLICCRRGRGLTPERIVGGGTAAAHPSGRTFPPGPGRARGGRCAQPSVPVDTGGCRPPWERIDRGRSYGVPGKS